VASLSANTTLRELRLKGQKAAVSTTVKTSLANLDERQRIYAI
jgi:hypothetical protein